MTYKNTEQKAKNVNTNITQWKTDIATAISNKGVQTSATDNKATFVKNINNIVSGGGFEPGSIIPIDLLEPPTEKTYVHNIGTNDEYGTIVSYRYKNKILYTDAGVLSIFDMETNKSKKFPNWSYSSKLDYALPINENIVACAYTYSNYTRYFALIDLDNETIMKDVNLSQYGTTDMALKDYGIKCCKIVKVEEDYFVLYTGHYAKYCVLVKIAYDDTVTLKSLKMITNIDVEYASNMITDGDKLFILSYDGIFAISTDLQLIASNTGITSYLSYYYTDAMIYHDNYIYISVKYYVYKLDINTFKSTILISVGQNFRLKQLDDNLLMHFYATQEAPSDSELSNEKYRTITFYNKDLEVLHKYTDPQSFISSAGVFEENSKKYILLEMIDGRMIKMDADNFNVIWDVQYGTNRNEIFYQLKEMTVDFYKIHRICHFYNDKLYLFRRTVSSISNDPKYTVKAQALLEYPQVLQLLRKGDE